MVRNAADGHILQHHFGIHWNDAMRGNMPLRRVKSRMRCICVRAILRHQLDLEDLASESSFFMADVYRLRERCGGLTVS